MNTGDPVIVFATDARGVIPTAVTASGVIRRAKSRPVHVRIVHSGVAHADLSRLSNTLLASGAASIAMVVVDASMLAELPPVHHLPVMSYARLLLPDLLPDESRVLYLDNDLIFRSNVIDLWDAWSAEYPVGAVADAGIHRLDDAHCLAYCRNELPDPALPAFNGGVLMIDLQQWRNENAVARAFDFLRRHRDRLNSADQDVLNSIFAGRWQAFDARWNVPQFLAWAVDAEQVRQVSDAFKCYAGVSDRDDVVYHLYGKHKPWNSGPYHPARRAWLSELAASGWLSFAGMLKYRIADNVRAWAFAVKERLPSKRHGNAGLAAA